MINYFKTNKTIENDRKRKISRFLQGFLLKHLHYSTNINQR